MPVATEPAPLLQVTDLSKSYSQGQFWQRRLHIKALDGVNLTLHSGKTLAVVGKSGSGKTTLAMCVALLQQPDSGKVWFQGRDVSSLPKDEFALFRPQVQTIFQDSASALPPHFTAARIVAEPLVVQRRYSPKERADLVSNLMTRVGLPPGCGNRLPHQFSGGERQRLAIARALVLQPSLIVLDEPFAGLDLSIRGRLINLLLELQAERSLAYLLISHDLDLVRHFSDHVLTLDHGRVVNQPDKPAPSENPEHPPAHNPPDAVAPTVIGSEIASPSMPRANAAAQMLRYLAARSVQALLLLLGVSFLSFVFLELAPGDFFQEMRLNPEISLSTVARLRAQYGLDQTLPVRYGHWLMAVLHGDFGYSFAYGSPAAPLLWVRARNTLLLSGTSLSLAWSAALVLGVLCAESPGSFLDRACDLGTSALLAVPEILLSLFFLALAVRTGWFPVGGMISPELEDAGLWTRIHDVAAHLVLPALALALCSLPLLLRHVRSAMSEVLNSPFIRSAHGHGIRRTRILFSLALPAALNPLTTLFGFSVASLLSVSLLTEVIMSWPGLGPLMLEAALDHDVYVVVGAVTLSTLLLVGATTAADLMLFAADPRIRSERLR
jgi:peptide/nickel transport system permease protein